MRTKEEKAAYAKAWYEANKEQITAKRKICYLENKDAELINSKIYHEANKDKAKAYAKAWYESNKNEISKKNKLWRTLNKDKVNKNNKKWRDVNKDKMKMLSKTWRDKNKDKVKLRTNNQLKKRRADDSLFKLKGLVCNSIRQSFKLKRFTKPSKTELILGCSYAQFRGHIEQLFEPWMNWDNQGKYNGTINYGWDIDHIIPLSSAKTTEELIKLNHYTNLQPLCSYNNRYIKRDNI